MNLLLGSMNPLGGGGLDKLTGGDKKEDEGAKTETGEDPEVIEARLEQEERRKEKHRRMEQDREKMRQGIRDKYKIEKKDENADMMVEDDEPGRIGASKRKTPEELAKEGEIDDSPMGMAKQYLDKAKTGVTGALDTVKGLLPFGK